MKKNMKVLIVLLIVILLAIISIIAIKIIMKPEYTVEDVLDLIDPKISDNMYLKVESHATQKNDESIIPDSTVETYINDKNVYERFSTPDEVIREIFFDFENKEQRCVFYSNKEICFFDLDYLNNPTEIVSNSLDFYKSNLFDGKDTYEYCGKEIIDGRHCIKVSVIYEEGKFLDVSEKTKIYFYIDEESKALIRADMYRINEKELELLSTTTITYSYDTVTDENIREFDINNYPGYTINEDLTDDEIKQ